ncbi:MAG: GPP34 family phosphoprotein [Bdellovibrionales bacterium]
MISNPPLTLLEEFLLLAFDEQTGQLHPLDPDALNCAIAGAVLMDLSLRNRVDSDLRDMFPVDPTPIGDELLDPVLKLMSMAPVLTPHPITYWLHQVAEQSSSLREKAMHRLEKRGVLHSRGFGFFWMFGGQRHLTVDEPKVRDVRSRLLSTLYSDEVPSPRNIMLTGLVDSCGLFSYLLNDTEMRDAKARIEKISHMDLIGQAVAKGITGAGPSFSAASGNI